MDDSVASPARHLRLVAVPTPDLTIDCACCAARETSTCDDCLVTYLVGAEAGAPVEFDEQEAHAVGLLADAGLVPASQFRPQSESA